MFSRTQHVLCFVLFVSAVFILRDQNATPSGFLQHQVARYLDNQITDALCSGTSQVNDITQSERDTANSHTATYARRRNGNPLVNFIEGPELGSKVSSTYGKPIVKYAIPFALLFIVSLVGCIYCTTVWCCATYAWCPQWKICSPPKPGGWRIPLLVGVLILAACLSIAGLVGIVKSSGVKQGGRKILCSLGVFAEKLLNGSPSEDWVGAQIAVQDFQDVLGDYHPMVLKLTAAPSLVATSTASGMAATLVTAQTANQLFYTTNFAKTVKPRPDPAQTTSLFYQPTYIKNLGDVRDAINNEMKAKKSIIDSSSLQADLGINELRAVSVPLLLVLQKAEAILGNVSKTLAVVEQNLTRYGKEGTTGVNAVGAGLAGLFAGNLVFGILTAVSTVLAYLGIVWGVRGLHLSWCMIATLTVLGWILATVLYPGTLVLFEVCDVGNRLLANSTFFNITVDKFVVHNTTTGEKEDYGDTVKDILHTCYHGNGDLLAALNLTEFFTIFENVFEPLDNIANLSTAVGPVPDSIVIPNQQSTVLQYEWGLISDAPETTADLATLNSLTNPSSNPCTQVRDNWVLNSTTCPATAATVFTAGKSADFNVKFPTCIGFDVWDDLPIEKRYTTTTFPLSCGLNAGLPQSTYLQKFVNNFGDARNSSASVFDSVGSGLSNVATANSLFMKSVTTATSAFNPVRDATKITYRAMWDQNTGFIKNSNCTFFRKSTGDLLDSVCVRFGNSLYSTMSTTITISSIGTLAAIAVYLLTWRVFKNKADKFERFIEE